MIPSVANGQRFFQSFSTATVFLSWKLPGSNSMHTTISPTAASQMSLYTWCQCTQRAFWYCMTAFAILHVWNCLQPKFVGFKVFVGATIYENWISWKFNPQNNSHTNISTSTVCTDCLHNYHQYITFDTQDQYTLWQTLCSTVYWHRSCAVSHVARPHPLLTSTRVKWYHLVPIL